MPVQVQIFSLENLIWKEVVRIKKNSNVIGFTGEYRAGFKKEVKFLNLNL